MDFIIRVHSNYIQWFVLATEQKIANNKYLQLFDAYTYITHCKLVCLVFASTTSKHKYIHVNLSLFPCTYHRMGKWEKCWRWHVRVCQCVCMGKQRNRCCVCWLFIAVNWFSFKMAKQWTTSKWINTRDKEIFFFFKFFSTKEKSKLQIFSNFLPRQTIMENTKITKINKTNELNNTNFEFNLLSQTNEKREFIVAILFCARIKQKFTLKKKQILCATTILCPWRCSYSYCSHANLLKFQQKRSMCHHRRKTIQMHQGQCNRLPILRNKQLNRFPRHFVVGKMFNQSKRSAPNDVIVTKMWDI